MGTRREGEASQDQAYMYTSTKSMRIADRELRSMKTPDAQSSAKSQAFSAFRFVWRGRCHILVPQTTLP
jgi:hypothetical protein